MEFIIRNEKPEDVEQVRTILRASFPRDAESKLVDALREGGKAIISLVAVHGDDVLGHILFSEVTATPLSKVRGLGLAPIAVRPNVQTQGFGSQLIGEGLRLCKKLCFDWSG